MNNNAPIELIKPTLSGHEPAISIQLRASDIEMRRLFDHIQENWQQLGKDDPYWSVISAEQFRSDNIVPQRIDEFYANGRGDLDRILKTLERNGIDAKELHSVLEYGCGVARVTRWLAGQFETIYGYDISKQHLALAQSHLQTLGVTNVNLHHLSKPEDISTLPAVDLLYSVIVLQHNPPPIIGYMIEQFIQCLNPRGVAIFQVPTYNINYSFDLCTYLKNARSDGGIEMHVFPQSEIFHIIRKNGANVVEVLEDIWIGYEPKHLSNTFLVRKD